MLGAGGVTDLVSEGPGGARGLLERFEDCWRGGVPPRLGDFLDAAAAAAGPPDPLASTELVEELIKVDLEYRWREAAGADRLPSTDRGPDELPGCPRLEDYVALHPRIGSLARLSVGLIGEEYRVRRRWGDRPGHAEYLTRFDGRGEALLAALSAVDAELAAETAGDGTLRPGTDSALTLVRSGPPFCPHCRAPIGPAGDTRTRDLVCPGRRTG
jgi:hypothetical protein